MSVSFTSLRARHPTFIYRSVALEHSGKMLSIRFEFQLGDTLFHPVVEIPLPDGAIIDSNVEALAFQLGMVELISYWKAACPPEIIVQAGALDDAQIRWWQDLIKFGLGEFFYRNQINIEGVQLAQITNAGTPHQRSRDTRTLSGDLILVGGGKDSTLTLELLKNLPQERQVTFALNPIQAAIRSVKIAGYPKPVAAKRTIDPTLLELNKAGYLNGHTPFSAYLAFLGTLVASLYGLKNVIVSNEQSANEQNVIFGALQVNHQYSKTTRFERFFREYATHHLHSGVHYFSFLRPIHDLAVSRLFAKHCREHFTSFRSCNVGQKRGRWCGKCPKCAFVYLTLFPYIGSTAAQEIFKAPLFERPEIIAEIRALCGLTATKPFECVGTVQESREALFIALDRILAENKTPPPELAAIAEELRKRNCLPATARTAKEWTTIHFLPPPYEKVLREAFTA